VDKSSRELFKVLHQHTPRNNSETHGKPRDMQAAESKPGSYAYEAEIPTTQPGHSLSQRNYRKTTLL